MQKNSRAGRRREGGIIWHTQGKLPAVRIGRSIRFDPDAVAAFLDSVRVGPGGLKEERGESAKNI
jgi:hypothetical protein